MPHLSKPWTKFVWLDTSIEVMKDNARTETLPYTDLDLSDYVTERTKIVILMLALEAFTIGTGYTSKLIVRKKGSTGTANPSLTIGKLDTPTMAIYYETVLCGVDDDKFIEYCISVGTGWQIDIAWIYLLGYIEG